MKQRCKWAKSELEIIYHDTEWCKIKKSDKQLFELLILEGMQAGLSWNIILNKRESFRKVFDNFDYLKCAEYTDEYLISLLENKDIIRHRLKIFSVRTNAIAFISVIKEFGSFYDYIWSFNNYEQINNTNNNISNINTKSLLSDKISKDMKKRGFKFVGSTIIYSYLQAIGLINDHMNYCDFK